MAKDQSIKIGGFRVRPYKSKGKETSNWQLDIPADYSPVGKRTRKIFPSKSAATSIAMELQRQSQISGRANLLGPVKFGVTFEEMSKQWFQFQQTSFAAQLIRLSTLEKNAYQLTALLNFMRHMDTAAITSETLMEYQIYRRGQSMKPATINSEIARAIQIFNWGKENNLCQKVPKARAIKDNKRRIEALTQDETVLLLNNFTQSSTRTLVRLVAETGMRKSEVFNLEWLDVDSEACTIDIRPGHDSQDYDTKNETSQRKVSISQSMIAEISSLPRTNRLLFPGKQGVIRSSIDKALTAAAKKAGITRDGKPHKVRLHMLRKAHATWQAEKGLPESTLQARLGHVPGSRITKEIYIQASKQAQREAVMEIGSNDNNGKFDT